MFMCTSPIFVVGFGRGVLSDDNIFSSSSSESKAVELYSADDERLVGVWRVVLNSEVLCK